MTSTAVATKIVGKAIYLELIPNPDLTDDQKHNACGWFGKNGTKQLLIFPAYESESGSPYNPVIMSRIVGEYTSRAQWETHISRDNPKPYSPSSEESPGGYVSLPLYSREEWAVLPEVDRVASTKLTLDITLRHQLNGTYYVHEEDGSRTIVPTQAWVVRDSKPLAVEITNDDMALLHDERKTPQAVIRRVNKIRESVASFPTKLV
jgi:hypothetical protein